MFPQEIIDRIFLNCSICFLQKTRTLQSKYVISCTKYSSISKAAYRGKINNIKWLLPKTGWKRDTLRRAIEKGRADTVKWLLDNGAPYEQDLVYISIIHNVSVFIQYIINKCPSYYFGSYLGLDILFKRPHILNLIYKKDYENQALSYTYRLSVDNLKFLIQNGLELTKDVYIKILSGKQLNVIKYLNEYLEVKPAKQVLPGNNLNVYSDKIGTINHNFAYYDLTISVQEYLILSNFLKLDIEMVNKYIQYGKGSDDYLQCVKHLLENLDTNLRIKPIMTVFYNTGDVNFIDYCIGKKYIDAYTVVSKVNEYNVDIIKVLLKNGISVNYDNERFLKYCISIQDYEMIENLLKLGAKPDDLPPCENIKILKLLLNYVN